LDGTDGGRTVNTALVLALLAPAAEPVPAPRDADKVTRGLQWLSSQQKDDGSWDGGQAVGTTVATARAGIALLMEGSSPSTGKYASHIRKTVAWFEKHAKESGHIAAPGPNELGNGIQAHAHALLFLVCAHDAESDPARAKRLSALIERGVAFAVSCQAPTGGWGAIEPSQRANGANGIQTVEVLHALLAARKAGFAVPRDRVDRAVRWLESGTNDDGSVAYVAPPAGQRARGGGNPDGTAGAAALALTGGAVRPDRLPGWVRSTRRALGNYERTLPQQNYLVMQQALAFARVAHALGEEGHDRLDSADATVQVVWSRERPKLFKAVLATQRADGSWSDQFGAPTLSTALALTLLQLDNGYLPAFTR
jgi:hypothetical protein